MERLPRIRPGNQAWNLPIGAALSFPGAFFSKQVQLSDQPTGNPALLVKLFLPKAYIRVVSQDIGGLQYIDRTGFYTLGAVRKLFPISTGEWPFAG